MDKNVIIETALTKSNVDDLLHCSANHQQDFICRVRGQLCKTKYDFFREISAGMGFPEYFGWNWNALNDCLTDLEWLRFRGIFIVFDDWKMAFQGEKDPASSFDTVKRCFDLAAAWWRERGIQFTVYYNQSAMAEEWLFDCFTGTSLLADPR